MNICPLEINWNENMSIYASERFLKSVSDEYGWLGGFDDFGRLRCILPFTIIIKATIKMVRFRIETIPVGEDLSLDDETTFLDGVVSYFKSMGSDIIIPATTNSIFKTYPHGALAVPYGTHILDLNPSEDFIFSHMSESHRRKIRLAEKSRVIVRMNNEFMSPVYDLVSDTFRRSAISFMDIKAFKRMTEGLESNVVFIVAEHQGHIQGGMMIPYSLYGAYYVYGGSIPNPATGAMNLMHWEAMRWLKRLGVNKYDFCGVRIDPEKGSKQEGLKSFKERFGPKLIKGYIWKQPIHHIKSLFYNIAVRVIKKGDIVDYERRKLAALSNSSTGRPLL